MSYADVLEIKVGLLLGLVNEKCNQLGAVSDTKTETEEEVIHGDGKMLMNM